MSVSKVKVISIIGLLSELDNVIKLCGESGAFQPDNALAFYENTQGFVNLSDKNPYTESLNTIKENAMLAGKVPTIVDISNFNVTSKQIDDYVKYFSEKLGDLIEQKNSISQKIELYQKTISDLKHFSGLSFELESIFSCKYIKVRFGSLPRESFEKITKHSENPYIMFFPCTNDNDRYFGVYFAPIDHAAEIDRIFSGLYFERLRVPVDDGTIEDHIKNLSNLVEEEENNLKAIDKNMEQFWQTQYDQCMRFYSKLKELDSYFAIKKYVYRYNNSFILVGWIPIEKQDEFALKLESAYGIEYSIDDVDSEIKLSPPVRLKNKKLFKPFEMFVDMYGLPCYNEVDPTAFVAIAYTLLFGIMFADLGQGLLLSLVGYLMFKLKNMPLGKILIRCGISAAVFGVVFGSVFGFEHALDKFYYNVFGLSEKPVEVMEPNTTNMIIYLSILIGIILLICSMILNIYSSFKQRDYENALFGPNGVAGITLYSSAVVGLICTLLFKINLFSPIYITCFIIIPLVLILFREILGKLVARDKSWKPESMGDFLVQNSFELFEVLLSYVTNTMSFLRVGAFVLVHAGMMLVVFTLANMCSPVGYVIIICIGNIFVMCLEALLVGIQVLRLNFYEMFSRFFKGEGRAFCPVKAENSNN